MVRVYHLQTRFRFTNFSCNFRMEQAIKIITDAERKENIKAFSELVNFTLNLKYKNK